MSSMAAMDRIRSNAKTLLDTVGVSRIVVVDDEYADGVERLLGICSELESAEAAGLPHLEGVQFAAPYEIWSEQARVAWEGLDREARRNAFAAGLSLESALGDASADGGATDSHEVDDLAAACLEEILGSLGGCEFVTLSLGQWEERREGLLASDVASRTLFLFDRGYSAERAGTNDEGFGLIREVQEMGSGYCGLITHTVSVGEEYRAWEGLAEENGLDRDRFVVVSKGRLNTDPPDYNGFFAMLRLAALGGRYAEVRSMALSIIECSLGDVRSALENLTVLDFDRMVFASSRREGVWEPDTLFRVFGILMRREAGIRLHADATVSEAVARARRVSASPEEIADALGKQGEPSTALQMQRYEMYDAGEKLNAWHTPIGLGDIFRIGSVGNHYILLGQPCDLVVRSRGLRNYEDGRLGPTVAVAEIARGEEKEGMVWGKLPFYEEASGDAGFANYARVHQVRLAVLDLCVFRQDGLAVIEVAGDCPDELIETWRKRYGKLQRHFDDALKLHRKLAEAGLKPEAESLAFPGASTTLKIDKAAGDRTVEYDVTRVMRLRQPWSAALLTEFAHYEARAAFEHYFGERVEAAPQDGDH